MGAHLLPEAGRQPRVLDGQILRPQPLVPVQGGDGLLRGGDQVLLVHRVVVRLLAAFADHLPADKGHWSPAAPAPPGTDTPWGTDTGKGTRRLRRGSSCRLPLVCPSKASMASCQRGWGQVTSPSPRSHDNRLSCEDGPADHERKGQKGPAATCPGQRGMGEASRWWLGAWRGCSGWQVVTQRALGPLTL